MATITHGQIAQADTIRPAGLGLLGHLRAWLQERRLRSETITSLHELDDRDLHDLNIRRFDFTSIADGTYRR